MVMMIWCNDDDDDDNDDDDDDDDDDSGDDGNDDHDNGNVWWSPLTFIMISQVKCYPLDQSYRKECQPVISKNQEFSSQYLEGTLLWGSPASLSLRLRVFNNLN